MFMQRSGQQCEWCLILKMNSHTPPTSAVHRVPPPCRLLRLLTCWLNASRHLHWRLQSADLKLFIELFMLHIVWKSLAAPSSFHTSTHEIQCKHQHPHLFTTHQTPIQYLNGIEIGMNHMNSMQPCFKHYVLHTWPQKPCQWTSVEASPGSCSWLLNCLC